MPGKRSRPTHRHLSDDSDSDISRGGGKPSTASINHNKRQRIQPASDNEAEFQLGQATTNNEDDDSEEIDQEEAMEETPDDQEEDDEEQEDDEDEAAEEASTQQGIRELEERNSQFTENTPADFGIITTVEMENFMCHSHVELKLGPLINFVIGHNGSGKSAVLTAITLCLGGKTASTNRGSNLKSFIKEGQTMSRITVKLKNSGEGYKTDLYPDIIIVERVFYREGGSQYKIKNKFGKIVSSKKEELDEICDFMGLQVDNPMNILTQDAARQFLNNSSESDKYKFFLKGVQLEQLDQDYQLLMASISNTEATLETKEHMLQDLKKVAEEARDRYERCKGQQELRDKIKKLRNQMAWAQIQEQEKILEDLERNRTEIEEKIGAIQVELDKAGRSFDKANSVLEDATQTLAEATEKQKPLEDEQKQQKEKFDSNRRDLMGLQAEQRAIASQIRSAQGRIAEWEKKIEDEQRRLAGIDGGINARLVTEKDETTRRRDEAIRKAEELEREQLRFKDDLEIAKQNSYEVQSRINAKQDEVERARDKVAQIRRAQSSYIGVYGSQMQNLLNAIEREGRWQDKPVGPMGMYIKLLRQDWSPILETVFGGALRGFVVTNYRDKDLLMNLMRTTQCEAPLFVSNKTPLNLSTPDERYTTILRILEVSNPLVLKQIVLNQAVEQSILIEDLADANQVWSNVRDGDGSNIKVCYAMNKSRKGWGHRLAGKAGAINNTPVKPFGGAPRMKTDLDSQMRAAQEESSQRESELGALRQEKGEKDQIVAELERSRSTFETRRRQLRYDKQRHDDDIERINNALEENVADNRLSQLETALESYRNEMKYHETQYLDLDTSKSDINAQNATIKTQLQELERQLTEGQTRITACERELSKAQRSRQQALSDKNHWHHKLEMEQTRLEEAVQKCGQQNRTIQEMIPQANQVCARVEVDRRYTSRILDIKLGKLYEELRASERAIGGSAEEIAAAYERAKSKYDGARQNMKQMERLLQVMRKSYKDRTYRWKKFRHYISARARNQFTWLMSQRAYRGRLRIDHARKELHLKVQPSQQETDPGREPKTLSGGERSFSTICLLLSLWEAMGSPIRCLDEFDVFMDPVNRKISVNMMIKAARRSIGKQFILITPQDMSSVEGSRDVKVIKLKDPERNQGTLTITTS